MVRIKVFRKSQLICAALAVMAALALAIGAWCIWGGGGQDGAAVRSLISAQPAAYLTSADASADRTGDDPSTDAGASLAVCAQPVQAVGSAVYVVNMDLSGGAPAPASLSRILAAGLSSRDAQSEPAPAARPLEGRSILIYHTHTHESYEKQQGESYVEISAYRTGDADHSIVRVGAELTALLEELGASVYHDTTDYEQDSLGTAYERSLVMLERLRDEGRVFDLMIDLHRDAYSATGSGTVFAAQVDGQEVARLMVLLGTGEGTSGGEAFDEKPDFERNLIWGRLLTAELERIAPGICRELMVKTGRYNQHVSERCLLIEVGHNRNTLTQALGAMPYLAEAIAGVLG